MKDRFLKFVEPITETGCWIWTGGVFRHGYGMFSPEKGKTKSAHRMSYELFVGEIPGELCVCHKCDTPLCVNPAHLFLGTVADNARDMDNKGRRVKVNGEGHGRSKITEESARKISIEYAIGGITMKNLGDKFGISATQVHRIVHKTRWKCLTT